MFDDMFSHFDIIPACDRQPDKQMDRHLATIQSTLGTASRGKNNLMTSNSRGSLVKALNSHSDDPGARFTNNLKTILR